MRTLVAAVVGILTALGVGFVLSFRTGFRPVIDLMRRVNRRWLNPAQLKVAGTPGAPASVVHHTGRSTGRAHRTPVGAKPVEDGFIIALPYGHDTDWVRNVLAAGGAVIEHEGEQVPTDDPTLLTAAEANHWFDAATQRLHRVFGVDHVLHVRTAGLDTQTS